ncbi:hypothetical protein ACQUEF_13280 [Vagococcus fluvialis]|uniref:hypothetical protein n=1 Tax=Vagococcus fluvialis TaxID=2738 RepID=UPI003D0D8736
MKKLNLLLLKKRPYLFILLCFSVFLMNLFLWNETSQLIRNIPVLKTLQSKSSSDIYELMYVPNATDSGEIKEFTPTEREEISQFFKESFFQDKPNLYLSKEKYINNTIKDTDDLIPVTEEQVLENVDSEIINLMFIHDLLILNISQDKIKKLEEKGNTINFPIKFISLKDSFQKDYDYYINNFIFGLVFSIIFMSFSLLIIYLLISSSLKLYSQEINLLRIVGVPIKKIRLNFILLLITPIILSFILFIIFTYTLGIALIFYDCIYLLALNSLLILISILIINKKLGGVLNA